MIDKSISPYKTRASVLGIGVALIASTCGASPFSINFSRCRTPKRCCSSVMTSARSENSTLSCNIAWVPTTISHSPSASFCFPSRFSFAVIDPINSPIFTPYGASIASSDSSCCIASTSVGTIKAPCAPLHTARNSAITATTVFPEPTSPCTSRFIVIPPVISFSISSYTLFCAAVSSYGKLFTKFPNSSFFIITWELGL